LAVPRLLRCPAGGGRRQLAKGLAQYHGGRAA
jgi:hypothetical protein